MAENNPMQYPYGTFPLSPTEEGAKKVFLKRQHSAIDYNPTQDSDTPMSLLNRSDFLLGVRAALRIDIGDLTDEAINRWELKV